MKALIQFLPISANQQSLLVRDSVVGISRDPGLVQFEYAKTFMNIFSSVSLD